MEEVTPFRLLMSKSVNFLYRVLSGSKITCVSPIFLGDNEAPQGFEHNK